MTKPTNPYAQAYASFCEQTKNHQLVVLQDNGLYRHMRVQEPGTRIWSWDVTTWPGHLATSGDIADGYLFTRELDMLDFFSLAGRSNAYYSDGAPSIDVRYWAEKLCGGRSQEVERYQQDLFLKQVREHLSEHEDFDDQAQERYEQQLALLKKVHQLRNLDEDTTKALFASYWGSRDKLEYTLRRAQPYSSLIAQYRAAAVAAKTRLWSTDGIPDELFDQVAHEFDWMTLGDTDIAKTSPAKQRDEILEDTKWQGGSESEAHKWLSEHPELFGEDTWEWNLRDYDTHFLFACYAIALTTTLWNEHVARNGSADTYVLVEGGLVQNDPALPVFDLDVLGSESGDQQSAEEVLELRGRILSHPQAAKDLARAVVRATDYIQDHGDSVCVQELNDTLAEEQRIREDLARREAERAERVATQRARQKG